MASQIAKHVFKVPVVISQIKDPLRKATYDTLGIETFCPTTLGSGLMMEAIGEDVLSRLLERHQIVDSIELTLVNDLQS